MPLPLSRRATLAGLATLALSPSRAGASGAGDLASLLSGHESALGGRIGLACLDTGTGRRTLWRAEERFPMASTFKLLLAAATLARIEAGIEPTDRALPVRAGDPVGHSPVTAAHVGGSLTLTQLCAATVTESDNGAANLLLDTMGGPACLTLWLRSTGDDVTRLDRNEPAMSEATPGDPRDTTTPEAMAATLQRLLLGPVLSPDRQAQLIGWMEASQTGLTRLRAGLPSGWRAGDKTGTGGHGSVNDVAILHPPGRAPWILCLYMTETTAPRPDAEAAMAAITRHLTSDNP
ncbi:class A beta-lactamase [Neotabrizicola shimadae]|uniref:Beta-lactamase n=1 Tax=Neotabrizicola shimadae TaxID=2807096 RepID=A0A8G1EBM9_9RHOB|nr:class A beta-lactamase [Neotabrizicola shimadae]QYZ68306.1 class A beta-lactamase [Neotabrizicola shimadae]